MATIKVYKGSANVGVVATPQVSVYEISAIASSGDPQVLIYDISAIAHTVSADAGPDQVAEPGDVVTLDGSASIGAGTWAQVAGTSVVPLSDPTVPMPTFTAPPTIDGDTLTFNYTVETDVDSVVVDILPVTERAVIGGVEVPMLLRAVAS